MEVGLKAVAGADARASLTGGGDDLVRRRRTQLVEACREAETARRSESKGSTGQSRSLFSEFCRLNVAARGNPVTGRWASLHIERS